MDTLVSLVSCNYIRETTWLPVQEVARMADQNKRRYFEADNEATASCLLCKKPAEYSGNKTNLFDHIETTHEQENTELQQQRGGEKSHTPWPRRLILYIPKGCAQF